MGSHGRYTASKPAISPALSIIDDVKALHHLIHPLHFLSDSRSRPRHLLPRSGAMKARLTGKLEKQGRELAIAMIWRRVLAMWLCRKKKAVPILGRPATRKEFTILVEQSPATMNCKKIALLMMHPKYQIKTASRPSQVPSPCFLSDSK